MKNRLRDLCLCRNTVIQMIKDRGYMTSLVPLDIATFTSSYPQALTNRATLKFLAQKDASNMVVHFLDDEKVGRKGLEALIEEYERENIYEIIFITHSSLSPACHTHISLLPRFNIEIFREEELKFNVTKHSLVPRHRILNVFEKENVLQRLKLKVENLPKILSTDVISRYYGAKHGDIIEITRKSQTAGECLYYRAVVDKSR